MKKIAIVALAAVCAGAFAQVNQQALINGAGTHTGVPGADRSFLEGAESVFGFGAQSTSGIENAMAEDFTITGLGFTVEKICLWAYQTGATVPTITSANWAISTLGDGPVVANMLNTGSPITTSWWDPNSVGGVFRTTGADTTGTLRRLVMVEIDIPDITLGAGTYYLSWNFGGSLTSGPWQAHNPGSMSSFGKNGLQSITNGAFAPALSGSAGVDLPFELKGTEVPEPATMAVLGLGAAALIRRRRGNK